MRRLGAVLGLALMACGPAIAHGLPVGDGKVSSEPKAGYLYACQTSFSGGGAFTTGSWFHGTTWDPALKPHVQGEVMWPDARLSTEAQGNQMAVRSNGLPVGEPTGIFPIARNDPAYQYDRNPNTIKPQDIAFAIPLEPQLAATPTCLPMGTIGFTNTGVMLYNAVDDAGRDAAAHEVQDLCNGHPQQQGEYHYHNSSPCLPGAEENAQVGWALDGFPVFGQRDAAGRELTNRDLDACHGRKEDVTINGRHYAYAYRLTAEYPYTIGCFSGSVDRATLQSLMGRRGPGGGQPGMPGMQGGRPPPPGGGQRPGGQPPVDGPWPPPQGGAPPPPWDQPPPR
jgi:hypothetical protein